MASQEKVEIAQELHQTIRQDQRLLERLKCEFGVSSERALTKRLNIPSTTLSRVMRGEGTLSWDHRFVIKDKLGFAALRNGVASLLPKKLSDCLIAASHRQFLRGIDDDEADLEPQTISKELIELLAVSHMPGASESIKALRRFRSKESTPESDDLNEVERALIIEVLVKTDQKFWQPLMDNLSASISSTESMLDLVSMMNDVGGKGAQRTNQLLGLLSARLKFSTASELAKFLDITPGTLSKVQSGTAKLPARSAFRMQCYLEHDSKKEAEDAFTKIDSIVSDPVKLAKDLKL